MSVLAKFQAERTRLSPMDRRIADFIVANAPLLRDYSSQQLADALHVSQSSIVKFAQRTGFKGYPDLKLSVTEAHARAAAVQATAEQVEAAIDVDNARADALWMAKAAADRQTRTVNYSDTIARVAVLVAAADTLVLAGSGIDGDAVHSFASRLMLLGRRCLLCFHGHELLCSLTAASPRDVLLVICGQGRGQQWLRGCRAVRTVGGQVVAVTRGRKKGLANLANESLVVAAHASQPHVEDLIYEAAMRHLLDDLFLRIVASQPGGPEAFAANSQRIFGSSSD